MSTTSFADPNEEPEKPIKKKGKKEKAAIIEPHDKLEAWLFKRFVEIGYDLDTARRMAAHRYDAHEVEDYLKKGATKEQIFHILAPDSIVLSNDDEIDLGKFKDWTVE